MYPFYRYAPTTGFPFYHFTVLETLTHLPLPTLSILWPLPALPFFRFYRFIDPKSFTVLKLYHIRAATGFTIVIFIALAPLARLPFYDAPFRGPG